MASNCGDVLVLTGTAGVGKSTMARLWAERRRGVHVQGDQIRCWITDREISRSKGYQEQAVAEIAAYAAGRYMAQNLCVALDYVWTPAGLAYLKQTLGETARVRYVWIVCEAGENERRDQTRKGRSVMGPRVHELRGELEALQWPDYLTIMDTTRDTHEQTIARIEALF